MRASTYPQHISRIENTSVSQQQLLLGHRTAESTSISKRHSRHPAQQHCARTPDTHTLITGTPYYNQPQPTCASHPLHTANTPLHCCPTAARHAAASNHHKANTYHGLATTHATPRIHSQSPSSSEPCSWAAAAACSAARCAGSASAHYP